MNNITLPDSLHEAAEQLAARAGFPSANEYVADLVRRDLEQLQQKDPDFHLRQGLAEEGVAVTPEDLAKRKREIEALLVEGLNSGPATPMTAEEWQHIRRELRERQK
jgi:antitoxin ParD1/3/4